MKSRGPHSAIRATYGSCAKRSRGYRRSSKPRTAIRPRYAPASHRGSHRASGKLERRRLRKARVWSSYSQSSSSSQSPIGSSRTLSYGQARRALLGRVLANHPRVLLLDEPWEGLDAPMAGLLNATLEKVTADRHAVGLCVASNDASHPLHARARARRGSRRARRTRRASDGAAAALRGSCASAPPRAARWPPR